MDLQSRQLGDKVTKITAMLRATNRPKGPLSTPQQAPKAACRPLAATLEDVHAGRPNVLSVFHLFYFTHNVTSFLKGFDERRKKFPLDKEVHDILDVDAQQIS